MNIATHVPEGARLHAESEEGANLAQLTPGEHCVVRFVRGGSETRHRLLEMGFVSGTKVRVVRLAPLGDPMQVELHGYHLSLRRSEASTILVQPS